ncbi:glycosyltransferase [Actinoalloteichus sp. AHMU CJ021]|uniref:N-glycosyltransferase n=1 Tax=Actinoalloteichus caeruleus DSM 43889 TaxID=1120930 RepID=A0ABT1JMU3_ACTCY|nr:glycosyltransferase [Actinoalloteichus caeruleus]AUS79195.1 glycosyltransferase [Actinoalloteichus sp. AHMU CJ021]MCP2333448.1 N-glycosyltransferase [Actinoalloteichus caeruleus DSM 43889]
MRVLCSVTGSPSHARAMLPVASAVARAGHQVLAVVPAALTHVFAGENFPVRAVLGPIEDILRDQLASGELTLDQLTDATVMIREFVGGPQVTRNVGTILPIAREFRPDLVLRDGTECAGMLVAEALGVPQVSVPSGGGNLVDPVGLVDHLNRRRREIHLPEQGPDALYRHGRLDCVPHRYTFNTHDVPPAIAYRQPDTVADREALPSWVSELDPTRPLVFGAVGTALSMVLDAPPQPGLEDTPPMRDPAEGLRAIIEGLGRLDCAAIVSTGGVPLPDIPHPSNVHVVTGIAQPLLLQCADLFVTHGGYNSIRESLRAGVPMAVVPQFGDQPVNADRVAELGLGRHVVEQTADGVASACSDLLTDRTTTGTVRAAQREMLALPHVDQVVRRLEEIAAGAGQVHAADQADTAVGAGRG